MFFSFPAYEELIKKQLKDILDNTGCVRKKKDHKRTVQSFLTKMSS